MTTPNTTGPSGEIQRYDPDIDPYRPVENGNYVRHSDHLAALSRAREDARREALEEAAHLVSSTSRYAGSEDERMVFAANSIRALIHTTPQGETKEKS